MSKLDSFIRRMTAQRNCLNHAAQLVKDHPGTVFEFGLGNGRTYDHLKELLPLHDIYVFERNPSALASCTPPEDHLFTGEILEALAGGIDRFKRSVTLLHNDLGTSDKAAYMELILKLTPLVEGIMVPGGIIVSNSEFNVGSWETLPLPEGVKPGRYYLYRAA